MKQEHKLNITYIFFISLVSALGGLLFGYDLVVVSGVIPQVIGQFNLTSFQLGFLVSCVYGDVPLVQVLVVSCWMSLEGKKY